MKKWFFVNFPSFVNCAQKKLYFWDNLKTSNMGISCNIRKSTKNPAAVKPEPEPY